MKLQNNITLYTTQPSSIINSIKNSDVHYAKKQLIENKYGEDIASIFTSAYDWFVLNAEKIVVKPELAESPIWGFIALKHLEIHQGYELLKLSVPSSEIILFDMDDWNRVLNKEYIGLTPEDVVTFQKKCDNNNIQHTSEIFEHAFYPLLKREITQSWQRLFRHHEELLLALSQSDELPIQNVQVALWKISPEWVIDTL